MSLLGMIWRFGARLRDRRVRNTSGGNDSNTSQSKNSDHPEFGLEFIDEGDAVVELEEYR